MKPGKVVNLFLISVTVATVLYAGFWIYRRGEENRILRKVIERLSSDSRAAEVLVTKSEFDELTRQVRTTIKFLEYDAGGNPLQPKYFTFAGNAIQFQTLVVRFSDQLVGAGDRLRGKSAYLFMKAFVLDENSPQMFPISEVRGIPSGYKIPGEKSLFEKRLWENFWSYALNPKARDRAGIKNAQIEAPGSLFLPGTIYTLRIEHDGGLRIDTQPIPGVLKGEKIS